MNLIVSEKPDIYKNLNVSENSNVSKVELI